MHGFQSMYVFSMTRRGGGALTSILGGSGGTHLQYIYYLVAFTCFRHSRKKFQYVQPQYAEGRVSNYQLWLSTYYSVMAHMLLESTHGTVKFLVKYLQCVSNGGYGTPNRILMLIFWYQKMCEFLINFWYQKIILLYLKLFSDIRKCHDFLVSEIIFWYQKIISDIRKSIRNYFLRSEKNFWYQKIAAFSDVRKSKFALVFAKINRYFMVFVVLESKLGHDPVVTSNHENVMKCTAPEYSCKPCKLHKSRNLLLEIQNTLV